MVWLPLNEVTDEGEVYTVFNMDHVLKIQRGPSEKTTRMVVSLMPEVSFVVKERPDIIRQMLIAHRIAEYYRTG